MRRRYANALFSLLLLAPFSCLAQQEAPKKILSGYVREEGSAHLISEARIELQNAMGIAPPPVQRPAKKVIKRKQKAKRSAWG